VALDAGFMLFLRELVYLRDNRLLHFRVHGSAPHRRFGLFLGSSGPSAVLLTGVGSSGPPFTSISPRVFSLPLQGTMGSEGIMGTMGSGTMGSGQEQWGQFFTL
jgi:hypothetical protein